MGEPGQPPLRRPRSATIGGVLALVLTGCALAFASIGTFRALSYGPPAAQVFMLIAFGITAVGLIASIRALQNSNAGRITTASLGLCVAVIGGLMFLGGMASLTAPNPDDRAPAAEILVSAAWSVASAASALLMLSGRADAWYVQRRRPLAASLAIRPGFAAPTHPRATTVVVLGTLSLVTTFMTGILGPVFGVLAWSTASSDLREIRLSGTRYADEGALRAGRVLGIVGTALSLVLLAALVVLIVILSVHSRDNTDPGHPVISVQPAQVF